MSYPFNAIWINQRQVSLDAIQRGHVNAQSENEASAFDFIRSWLSGQDLFYIKTSGSTGPPKTITITRQQMQASASRTVKALGLENELTALVCLNTNYIAGKMMLVRALEHSMKLVIVDPSSNPFQNLSINQKVDCMAVAPIQLQTLLSDPDNTERLNSMKAILIGGAPVSIKLKADIKSLTCPVYETYGMTETISNVALKPLNTLKATDYFTLLPGVSITFDDRNCLVIHDEIQAEPMVTNDVVELQNNGFRWLGRADNVINSGGIKIHPEKVESDLEVVFQHLEKPRNYFIGSSEDQRFGEVVTLYIEGAELPKNDISKLSEGYKRLDRQVERPQLTMLIDKFHYTKTGKIDRKMTQKCPFKCIPELTIN